MYKMHQFVQAVLLLLFLSVLIIVKSENRFIGVMISGVMMILFTVRSLIEDKSKILCGVQAVLSVMFAALSGEILCWLILYECRIVPVNKLRILFPAAAFLMTDLAVNKYALSFIIFYALIIFTLSLLLYLIEYIIEKYILIKIQNEKALSITAVNEMYEKKLNQELVMKNFFADKNARLEERENISRNIHNSVGHSITAAIMTLDAADMLFDAEPEKAREKMNTANERIRTSLDSIRHAVRVLDSESQFVTAGDFVEDIRSLINSFTMDTAIEINSDFTDADEKKAIPHEHTEFLTGAVQELLSNGVRHGKADKFTVIMSTDSMHIRLIISDNGKSDFSTENQKKYIRNGFGLKKIISYLDKCGGSAEFTNPGGFKTELIIPLKK